ncbi:MAG TPA: iron-containing alcohol dehydrogenase [Verrucomicrobiota bacterium]|nr:MAG: 1,3-propanediol dehydrogenase [Verrucomicrobia bacterium ADurb.Bin118]HPY30484.1 iron-containing alcohol dehydrogenase [Verrucomicrobiota bacterium]HQB15384.1 iron-containing alcohol dehydrogenase [Verrucomicrobiota bacterium]
MNFEFATATRIIFGAGRLQEIGDLTRGFGKHALVVTGRQPRHAEPLLAWLARSPANPAVTRFSIAGEPTLSDVRKGVEIARAAGGDFVIALGGGSAIDAGKAIAAMLTNDGELLDYLEVIGAGRALTRTGAPFIAIPTTAGTGAEVTRNAVLTSPEHRCKVSLRSPLLLPKVALIDPELTYGLPPAITARTGLDALTQLIEPYTCCRPNPMVDALCAEGIRRAARSLRAAWVEGSNRAAREDMCVASLFGGLALANAGLGAVHGLAAPIGGRFAAPHGAVCAALLPAVMTANLRALRSRAPDSGVLRRYDAVAQWLTGEATATADAGVAWVSELVSELRIPKLRDYGMGEPHIAELAAKATRASSMKANPLVLTGEELAAILRQAMG